MTVEEPHAGGTGASQPAAPLSRRRVVAVVLLGLAGALCAYLGTSGAWFALIAIPYWAVAIGIWSAARWARPLAWVAAIGTLALCGYGMVLGVVGAQNNTGESAGWSWVLVIISVGAALVLGGPAAFAVWALRDPS